MGAGGHGTGNRQHWHDQPMREWIRRRLPSEEKLQAQRGLRWLAPLLRRPALWHLDRRRVALGAAIGVFCGLLIPLAQVAGAAVLAVLLRANLPVAAVATLVTNPVTTAPILVLAYRTGAALLGEPVQPAAAEELAAAVEEQQGQPRPADPEPGWVERARAIGKPLFVGMAVFAVAGGLGTWALVQLAWIMAVRLRRRRRRLRASRS